MSVVFFDCESDCVFARCPGASRDQQFQNMQATIVCALRLDSKLCLDPEQCDEAMTRGAAMHWWRDVAPKGAGPFDGLLNLFDDAELIVAYNGLDFDFPLLRKHYTRKNGGEARYMAHRLKCLDPFALIRAATGHWPKLGALLEANNLSPKTANGVEAIAMWEEGRRSELLDYCTQDVAAMAWMCLLSQLRMPQISQLLPNSVFGVASALAARRASKEVAEPYVIVSGE